MIKVLTLLKMDLHELPQDIVDHIGEFYITKQMKLQWRIDKLYNKVEELKGRTIDEWIEHIKFSKRYNVKVTEINNEYVNYTNSFGDTYKVNKNELIHQGYIKHTRSLYHWYIQRIISASTPTPRYEGEKFINILGEKLTAKMVRYGDYGNYNEYDDDDHDYDDENYSYVCLVFTHDEQLSK
jgi:hypothetical protein